MNFFSKHFSKGSMPISMVVALVLLGVVILFIFLFSGELSDRTNILTDDNQCLHLLSNLDFYTKNGGLSRVKSLYDKSCLPKNVTITDERRFISELKTCNSKAQRVFNQEEFVSRTSNICIPCNNLVSAIDISINSDVLDDDFSNIELTELRVGSKDETSILLFRISDGKIEFIIVNDKFDTQCDFFFNS